MPQLRILLGGGGSAEDERPLFEQLAVWVGAGRLLYLPIAADGPGPPHLAWLTSVLAPLGVQHIDMWTDLTSHQPADLEAYTALFFGGGNTYWLLHQVRSAGFVESFRHFALQGGIIYGGSAGAILLGADIATCAHIDHNTVELRDTTGLDLVDGHAVWCHYQPADWPLCAQFLARTGLPTFLLSERSGLWVSGPSHYISLGFNDVGKIVSANEDRPQVYKTKALSAD